MKGSYVLLLYLPADVTIKTKGKTFFLRKGFYAYVGSAMNSLEKRVMRHFKKNKKLHWHIDYLTLYAKPIIAYLIPSDTKIEEELSQLISTLGEVIAGFGSSDLSVKGNLFFFGEYNPKDVIRRLLNRHYQDILEFPTFS
ncbi:DUF123 domain-containing protein [Pyrococcus sp. ST04]|uniref:GIY-YIG nuclease family protein n=1 Tax=Pyrococcus sp. ST04 TaxID=1183377 RepID=UPI0002605E01|nr:DUF123 domain-containing protein [Pyrococcus sp. ST04]AFK22539.1 hypothetical protein containing DUF123 domain [Pyrococcus sp. ST04]